MAYVFQTPSIGMPPIANTAAAFTGAGRSVPWKLGDIARAVDPTLGAGEFIYLKGLASTAIGEAVIYDHLFATKRGVAGDRGPVAIAMSANVASQYGWYQIAGTATLKTVTVAAAGAVYLTATPGTTDDAVVSGDKIDGARFKTADGAAPPAAGFAYAQIDRPSANGNG